MTRAPAADHDARPRSSVIPHPRRGLLERGRPAARRLIRRWYDVRVVHSGRFPDTGPVVVAANHVGFVDGPLLAIFGPRPVHALTKEEMFVGPLGPFLTACGQIPLQRRGVDPRAIRTSLRVLRDGGAVGVFPEGSRGAGEFRRFHRGAAYLSMVSGAPVVPVTFLGTREPGGSSGSLPRRRARIDLVVGEPVDLPTVPWPRKKADVAQCSLRLRDHMLLQLQQALADTGRELPGPLSEGDFEPLPGNLLEGQ